MGELVDEGDFRLAGEHGREIHLLKGRASVLTDLACHHGQVADPLGGVLSTVGLDKADDHVRSTLVATPTFVQHGPGLADACDGT